MSSMTLKDLERILYFEYYVVLEPGLTALKDRQLLSEDEYLKAQDEYGQDSFTAMKRDKLILDEREKQAAIVPTAPEAEPLALPPAE